MQFPVGMIKPAVLGGGGYGGYDPHSPAPILIPPPPLPGLSRPSSVSEAVWNTTTDRMKRQILGMSTPNINATPSGGGMALDLGNLLQTLGSQYIQAKYQPAGVNIVPQGYAPGALMPQQLGLAQTDGRGGYPEMGPGPGYCYDPRANCGAGKWIKRSRRRRKRLATASDIADIAALMGAFQVKASQPTALTTWIATRGR